jgi:hypothetical protein
MPIKEGAMKKKFSFFITLIVFFGLYGCGSTLNKSSWINITANSAKWSSNGFSIIPNNDGPKQMAMAIVANKEADARLEIIKAYVKETGNNQNGSVEKTNTISGRYWLGLKNNDQKQGIYVYHPEISGYKIWAKPNGGFTPFAVNEIPLKLVVYNQRDNIVETFQPMHDPFFREKISRKKIVDGGKVDLIFQIDKIP